MVGIYVIENLVNGKKYVGRTVNYNRRMYLHLHCLRAHRHPNTYLQKSWDKYGSENFKFELVEDITEWSKTQPREKIEAYLNSAEKSYIKKFRSSEIEFGYNMSEGGDGATLFGNRNPSFGKRKSDEVKQKISNTINKNKSHSGERNGRFGKPVSDSTKIKISLANKGRVQSDDERARRCQIMREVVNRPENIKRREERKHDPIRKQKYIEYGIQRRKYTDELIAIVRNEYTSDADILGLAKKYNMPNKTCMEIVHHNGHFKNR